MQVSGKAVTTSFLPILYQGPDTVPGPEEVTSSIWAVGSGPKAFLETVLFLATKATLRV